MHPAATTCPGGEEALLDRYKVDMPACGGGDGEGENSYDACIRLVPDAELAPGDHTDVVAALCRIARSAILGILASSRDSLSRDALEKLGQRALDLGCADAVIVDPFDSARSRDVLESMLETPGVHAVVFASPCAQLQHGAFEAEPAEIDRYACASCHRCQQITGCPAISFTPPVFSIDPGLCAGCDLCREHCRTHVIYSPRNRMTPEERSRARYAAALQ
ncbi:MAG: hypothetical protein Q4B77_05700 [Coriobacteriaceae bacterium]|nr:hypothetical protein [Coriobacteriaceae bacterium]